MTTPETSAPAAPPPSGQVALVVVSHSEALADAAVALGAQMLHGSRLTIEVAAGVDNGGDDGGGFGTDALKIKEAIERADSPAGVLVLVDMGSAILSTELAIEMLDDPAMHERVVVSAAPFVEGLVVAAVSAAGGAPLAEVDAEAREATAGKLAHLGIAAPGRQPQEPTTAPAGEQAVEGVFRVLNPHGLHARPAARLVGEVRGLDARIELTNLTGGSGPVPAGSLSRVATLGAQAGHEIQVRAVGAHAQEAVDRLLALAERRFDETEEPPTAAPAGPKAATALTAATAPATHAPMPGSPGVAVGPARHLTPAPIRTEDLVVGEPEAERRLLDDALERVRREVREARDLTAHTAGDTEAAIFEAHLALLDDSAILDPVHELIEAGHGAVAAWSTTLTQVQQTWAGLADAYLRERAADVAALRQQVLEALTGASAFEMSAPGILVARDLTPAQTARLDLSLVQGVLLAEGSPTSHAAILARARDIPLVVSAGAQVLDVAEGTLVALDGATGELHLAPDDTVVQDFRARDAEQRRLRHAQLAQASREAMSADGVAVVVGANLGSVADAEAAHAMGADKAGLVRSEFLFLNRTTAPDLDEQTQQYRDLGAALGGRTLTLRTLDVGGDKPLAYLPVIEELNPFLGRRGVRLSLQHPDLLRTQLQAMCRAAQETPISVMVPMISLPAELLAVRALLEEAAGPAGVPEGLRFGMMVEVPSAALKLEAFVPHLDFVSIGTNDLTQYAMAAERGNAGVDELNDPLDPGVLQLIDRVVRASASRIGVSVCGEAAADPLALPLLVGLGVREVSVSPPAVPRVKEQVRQLDVRRCAEVAQSALRLGDAAAVRLLVQDQLSGG